jgi:heptosyltransferase III
LRPLHAGRWAPIGEKAKVLSSEIKCVKCKKTNFCACMQDILPSMVYAEIK